MLLPGVAWAQEGKTRPEQPLQELFFTEVVYPQSRHELQITVGSLVDRTRQDKSALVPIGIEFGLTDRLQVGTEWDGYSQFHTIPVSHPRTSKVTVGAKYTFLNSQAFPLQAALGMDVEFPRGDAFSDGEGETGTQFEPFLALALDLGRGVTLFGSGGLSLERDAVTGILHGQTLPDDTGTLSGGALVQCGRVTLAGEYTSRSDQAPWRLNGSPLVTPSVVFHPGGDWELGFGLPIGTQKGTHRPGLALHVIKEF